MTSISEVQKDLVEQFKKFATWEDRYKKIVELGKDLAPYPEEFRTEDFRVRGCQSQVWLYPKLNSDGTVLFLADSDAVIVRGLVSLLLRVYSNRTPDEILSTPADFLKELGFESHLSPSRSNGLYAMLKQIIFYAMAFKAKK